MENPSELEENMQVLEAEMLILKDLRYAGDRQLQEWMQDVKGKAGEVENLQQELGKLKTGTDPTNVHERQELTMKVVQVLKDIRLLKQEANAHPESLESLLLELGIEKPKQYSYEDLSSFTSNFSIKVGQGASAHVYKGQLPNGVQVAVKVLLEHDVVKEMFMAEVRTMGRTYHRNLIKLYGFCFDQTNKALVYEYMENGSLDRVLYENHHSIEWEKLYGIATDIAKAIAYLHDGCTEQIIHHDVKAANVLLDSKFSPKVTDFGLAKLLNRDKSHITLTRIRGTPGYLAPEMWMPASLVTYKCDVYSYGMLLFEVLGRRNNSQNNKQWFPKQVWEKFEAGQLDEIIDDCGIRENNREKATVLSMVALWCAQFTAQVRPTMSTVVKMLEKEISITMPPNPFFPSNFVSSLHEPTTTKSRRLTADHLWPDLKKKSQNYFSKPRLPDDFEADFQDFKDEDEVEEVFNPFTFVTKSSSPTEEIRPKVAAPVSLQPSNFPEEIHPKVAAISLQPPDMPEVNHPKVAAPVTLQPSHFPEEIRPKVAAISLQPPDMPELIHPNVAVSISVQPSDLPQAIDPKVTASISAPSHVPEASPPKEAASFSLQSIQPSHPRKAISANTAYSTEGRLHQERYGEQDMNSPNKEFASSSTLEPFPKANRRYQSLLPTSWSQLFPKFIVDRKRSSRKTGSAESTSTKHPTKIKKPLEDGKGYESNMTGAYTGSATAVPTVNDWKEKTVKEEANNLFFFGNPKQFFDLEELLRGSAEVLGKGTIGTMYKTNLEVGLVVVVKRLKNPTIPEREFKEKIEFVGLMDHKNVLPLMGYYCSKDECLILYDYMENGSLSKLLHGSRGTDRIPLDWKTRLRVAFGAVGGIEYLHSQGPRISHGNIKSSNVLITKDYDGIISDFSLAQLVIHSSNPNRVPSGYCAPEATDIRSVSQEADVYSFGVLLLELLTGKAPTNPILNEEGIDLPKWMQSVLQEEWTIDEVIDIELLKYEKEEMIPLLLLAMECASVDTEKRPKITEVAQRIHSLMLLSTT